MQETTKICLEEVDDGKRKMVEAVLLLIHSGLLTMLIKKYMARSSTAGGQTILQINSKGDWEYALSNKREAPSSFKLIMISYSNSKIQEIVCHNLLCFKIINQKPSLQNCPNKYLGESVFVHVPIPLYEFYIDY